MTREEAVNELNDRIKSAEYVDSDYIDCVSVDTVKMAISALSVPETNVGDTISRQAAIDALIDALAWTWSGTWSEKTAIDAIKNLSSIDAVEVVRCRDCKWWNGYYRECESPNWNTGTEEYIVQPAGMFCGWAERRDDADESVCT